MLIKLVAISPLIHTAEFVLTQEKQSAVLKLLASNSSQAVKPNSDVVLVAGDCPHICIAMYLTLCVGVRLITNNCHQIENVCLAGIRSNWWSWFKGCPDLAAAGQSCEGASQG